MMGNGPKPVKVHEKAVQERLGMALHHSNRMSIHRNPSAFN